MAAISVPRWRATANAFSADCASKSFQPNSHGTSSRCPLDEIGRNSDRPCTRPSTKAWKMGIGAVGGGRLGAAHRHVVDDEGHPGGAHGEPVDVTTHFGDVEEHALQRGGDGELSN